MSAHHRVLAATTLAAVAGAVLCNRATDLPLATAILAASPALLAAAVVMVRRHRSAAVRGPVPAHPRPTLAAATFAPLAGSRNPASPASSPPRIGATP